MASRILRHVCGENTAASCAHRHIHPMHLKQFICDIVCAKKKANLDFWLTIWLSFERRKIFLEMVLQMLLICVCYFSCSSTITPSRRCFETCFIGVVSNFRFKGNCFSWCFCLVAINMHFVSSDSVPSDFYNTIQRHHIDFIVNPYVYYLCCH